MKIILMIFKIIVIIMVLQLKPQILIMINNIKKIWIRP